MVLKPFPYESDKAKEALKEWTPTSDRCVFKFKIPETPDSTKTHSFFVWKPLADPFSVTGRVTCGYPAWDPQGNNGEGDVVFVKDLWHFCEEGLEKESAILQDLNCAQCHNVPKLICSNDILHQATIMKKFVNESWNLGGQPEHIVD